MSDTPFADQFVNFQSLLDKVGPAYHEMKKAIQYRDEGMKIDLEPYRENYRISKLNVLIEYDKLLSEIQKNSEKKIC